MNAQRASHTKRTPALGLIWPHYTYVLAGEPSGTYFAFLREVREPHTANTRLMLSTADVGSYTFELHDSKFAKSHEPDVSTTNKNLLRDCFFAVSFSSNPLCTYGVFLNSRSISLGASGEFVRQITPTGYSAAHCVLCSAAQFSQWTCSPPYIQRGICPLK
jgi:hypothetical protein